MSRPRSGPARRAATALVSLALGVSLSACSGDDDPSGSEATPASAAPSPPAVKTVAGIGRVRGKLSAGQRGELVGQVKRVFDGWVDAAYAGDDPRTDVDGSFPGFTRRAADQARRDSALMSNAEVGDRVDEARPVKRRLLVDTLAVRGRPVTVTARFTIIERLSGDGIDRRDRIGGRLLLTRAGRDWKVFGYTVDRGVAR